MKKNEKLVALLRGINVGGKNKLPMRDLVLMFEAAGCTNVVTYIQSGNVVFEASPKIAKTIAAVVTDAIRARFTLEIPVVVRTAAQMKIVASANPFEIEGNTPDFWHVAFLKDVPLAEHVSALDPNRSPGDRFVVVGGDVYLHVAHAAKTKLTNAFFDSKLKTVSTGRNWRTVLKLVELSSA
ncbi:MAG TPA: DUF1697 domain-containing protein [Polyangiaceae bacterium]